jgi:hypothetical protein
MNLPTDYVEQLRREYPQRLGDNGWIAVRTLIPRALSAGATWERILCGTRAYRAHCDSTGKTGTELVKQARTFFGPQQYWEEWADMQPAKTAHQQLQEKRWEALKQRAGACGFRPPTPVESPDVYETALKFFERERGAKVVSMPRAKSV